MYSLLSYSANAQGSSWQQLPIGAGGWLVGMDIASDGTMVVRPDTFGAYLGSTTAGTVWKQMVTTGTGGSMPANSVGFDGSGNPVQAACYEIKIAPSNTNIMYMVLNGLVYVTSNKGGSWTQTNFTKDTGAASDVNNAYRMNQQKMAIHPTDPNTVLVGTPSNGMFYTNDGGANWNACSGVLASLNDTSASVFITGSISGTTLNVTGIGGAITVGMRIFDAGSITSYTTVVSFGTGTGGNGTYTLSNSFTIGSESMFGSITRPGVTGICFDPATPTTIYAAVFGRGVYRTTTGVTGTWALITGGATAPLYVEDAKIAGGAYICCGGVIPTGNGGGNNTTAMRYSSGSWTLLGSFSFQFPHCITINPADATNYVVITGNGVFFQSADSGATWIQYNNSTTWSWTATDIPWLAQTGNLFPGGMIWDPLVAKKQWISCGVGVASISTFTSTSLSGSAALNFVSQSKGIEQLVAREIISPAGGVPAVACEDRTVFKVNSLTSYPSFYAFSSTDGNFGDSNLNACWTLDYAKNSPSFITGIMNNAGTNDQSGYSTDGGTNWTKFTNAPFTLTGNGGGTIAASTTTNLVAMQWASSVTNASYTLNGGSTAWNACSGLPSSGWNMVGSFGAHHFLQADTVTANKFYIVHSTGTYVSTDGGATWTQTSTQVIDTQNFVQTLRSVPGNAGHLFYTAGPFNAFGAANIPFYHSTNGGVGSSAWTAVTNVKNVWTVGLGAPSQTYPTIWIVGFVNKASAGYKYGVWSSPDAGTTWNLQIDFPFGLADTPQCICGDGNDPTKCYIGFGGSGFGYGQRLTA